MSENSLDAIVLMAGTSLQYLAGIRWWGGERTFALVLPAKGNAFYVCPAFEEGRAREQIKSAPEGEQPDVRIWQEDESPYQRLAHGLLERGIATGKIGLEETIRFVFAEGIAKAASQATVVSATPVTAGCRMIKSSQEIAVMRLASEVTLAAYEATYRALKDGMTQPEVEDLVQKAHAQLGFSGGADVQVGEFSAFPHGSVTPQVVHEGTIVLMDGGCAVEGYQSDITRTFVLGKASDKMKNVFEIVHRAQSAALAAAKPGGECGSVDAAARKVVTDAGARVQTGQTVEIRIHGGGGGPGGPAVDPHGLPRDAIVHLDPHLVVVEKPAGISTVPYEEGERGTLVFDGKGWHVQDGLEASDKGDIDDEYAHQRNFLDCIKNGRRPNADIEEGHKSTRLCHLGNIAYRTGRSLRFDASTETIAGDAEANQLLGRIYRKPFIVPEKV